MLVCGFGYLKIEVIGKKLYRGRFWFEKSQEKVYELDSQNLFL